MSSNRSFVIALPLAALATGANAQNATDDQVAVLEEYDRSQAVTDYLGQDDLPVSELLGTAVSNEEGEEVGQIDDLIISRDNEVVSAVLSAGGFLGLGERRVLLPYEALRVSAETQSFFVEMSEEELAQLPEYRGEQRDLESLLELRERAQGESGPEQRSNATGGGVTPENGSREGGQSQTDGGEVNR